MNPEIAATASAISAALSLVVTIILARLAFVQFRYARRKLKVNTITRLLAYRGALTSTKSESMVGEFTVVLNEIGMVFHDSSDVVDLLKKCIENVIKNRPIEYGPLLKLWRAMCDDVKINHEQFSDDFFFTPFNVKHGDPQ